MPQSLHPEVISLRRNTEKPQPKDTRDVSFVRGVGVGNNHAWILRKTQMFVMRAGLTEPVCSWRSLG